MGKEVQTTIGFLIFTNFVVQLVSAQLQPEDGSLTLKILESVDLAFNAIWTFELTVNIVSASNMLKDFFRDPWNWFDCIVVFVAYLPMLMGGSSQVLIRLDQHTFAAASDTQWHRLGRHKPALTWIMILMRTAPACSCCRSDAFSRSCSRHVHCKS